MLYDMFCSEKIPDALTRKETMELLKLVSGGSTEARDKLIKHNIRLVMYTVKNNFTTVDYDKQDLVSIGIIGLIKAIETFDLSKGFEFATYAVRCINNEILMFLRKLKKDNIVDSFENCVYTDQSGDTITLEDTLCDDADIDEDFVKKEIYVYLRKLVMNLPDRDREIISLKFGFNDDVIYTQPEIAKKLGVSQSYVSRLVHRILKQIEEQMVAEGILDSHINCVSESRRKVKKKRRITSIYEFFKNYSIEEVDAMIAKLSDSDKVLLSLKYGSNFDCLGVPLSKENSVKYHNYLLPKMKRLLANPYSSSKKLRKKSSRLTSISPNVELQAGESANIGKKDYVELADFLDSNSFGTFLRNLSIKESIIISLKFGFVDGKRFSNETIAKFLGIEPLDVIIVTKKVLLMYRSNANKFISGVIVSREQSVTKKKGVSVSNK